MAWEGYQLENKVCANMVRFQATKPQVAFANLKGCEARILRTSRKQKFSTDRFTIFLATVQPLTIQYRDEPLLIQAIILATTIDKFEHP